MKPLVVLKHLAAHKAAIPVAGVLIGAAVFIATFGVAILNPFYTTWLIHAGDLTVNYYGWEFYRASALQFPLGVIGNLSHFMPTSIVYTDSLPLVALPLRLLSFMLPQAPFQYFGIYGLICFMLQGLFGGLIIKKYTANFLIGISTVILVVVSQPLIARMFGHTALASQWLVLACIYLIVSSRALRIRTVAMWWIIILGLTPLIHAYYLPMVGVLFLSYCFIGKEKLWHKAAIFFIGAGVSIVTFWLAGGFVLHGGESSSPLDLYTADLNTLYNASQYSSILPSFAMSPGAYEGIAYLGLGAILIIIAGGIVWAVSYFTKKKILKPVSLQYRLAALPVLALFIYSLGPTIRLNGNQLMAIEIPHRLEGVLSIFRASGRFSWVLFYVLILVACISIARACVNRRKEVVIAGTMVITLAAILQIVDITGSLGYQQKRDTYYQSHFEPDYFALHPSDEALFNGKKYVAFLDPVTMPNGFYAIAGAALRHDMVVSDLYAARKDVKANIDLALRFRAEIQDGQADPDVVYVATSETTAKELERSVEIFGYTTKKLSYKSIPTLAKPDGTIWLITKVR